MRVARQHRGGGQRRDRVVCEGKLELPHVTRSSPPTCVVVRRVLTRSITRLTRTECGPYECLDARECLCTHQGRDGLCVLRKQGSAAHTLTIAERQKPHLANMREATRHIYCALSDGAVPVDCCAASSCSWEKYSHSFTRLIMRSRSAKVDMPKSR